MSRRDHRRRLDRLENEENPPPRLPSVLEVPREVLDAGSDSVDTWVAEQLKKYPPYRGNLVLMPEWDDADSPPRN